MTGASSGFGYNGEYTDASTGMIYLRARFYDPAMNRFSQKDTLRLSDSIYTAASAATTIALGNGVGSVGGFFGGVLGNMATQSLDTGKVDISQSIDTGIINGVISGVATPFAGVAGAVGNDVAGNIFNAIVSSINELVFDTSSATISAKGVTC